MNIQPNGETNEETIFITSARQHVWATFQGGEIVFGTCWPGRRRSGMSGYEVQPLNQKGSSEPASAIRFQKRLVTGVIEYAEFWKWTDGDKLKVPPSLKRAVLHNPKGC